MLVTVKQSDLGGMSQESDDFKSTGDQPFLHSPSPYISSSDHKMSSQVDNQDNPVDGKLKRPIFAG